MRILAHILIAALAVFIDHSSVWSLNVHLNHGHVHRDHLLNGPPSKLSDRDVPATPSILPVTIYDNRTTKTPKLTAYIKGKQPDTRQEVMLQNLKGSTTENPATYWWPPSIQTTGKLTTRNSIRALKTSELPVSLEFDDGADAMSFVMPTLVSARLVISEQDLDFFPQGTTEITDPDPENASNLASNRTWGFIEYNYDIPSPANNYTSDGITINPSFVDWVSLPVGFRLTYIGSDGIETKWEVGGPLPGALKSICDALEEAGGFWPNLCPKREDGQWARVTSPNKYQSLHGNVDGINDYYDDYVNQVWEKYSMQTLIVDSQDNGHHKNFTDGTLYSCNVRDELLWCRASNNMTQPVYNFAKPTSGDIWGCNSGPFANIASTDDGQKEIYPRICAAFTRSTLLRDGIQPRDFDTSQYYVDEPINYYSKEVHENLQGNIGYTFSFDDVAKNTTEARSGVISTKSPILLEVYVNDA
ncbi:hypothetical protein F5Y15DRAFT_430964 [Xylariaceae sp. FL0016]|nr:hypothetical protein F5Y15DRAFT_430964 [Xylariaceae sp. FL0016]